MPRSSFAFALALVALPVSPNANAQSSPVPAGAPPSSFTLGATADVLSLRSIAPLTATCHLTQGPSPTIRCDSYRFKTFAPAVPPPADRPFPANPGQWSAKDWQDSGRNVAMTSFSMHVAGNLATEDSTRTFLKGLGGDVLAAKAPEIFEMIKSAPVRYAAVAGMVVGGTVYLYEALWGGGAPSNTANSDAPQGRTFRLLGTVSQGSSVSPSR